MAVEITTPDQYRKALDRITELRASGETGDSNRLLQELEAAVAAYEILPDQPAQSKGRPAPKPFRDPDRENNE